MSLINRQRVLLALRTAGDTSQPHIIMQGCRLIVYVAISAQAGAGAIVVTVEEEVPGSNEWAVLLTSASLNAVGITRLEIGPGVTVTANVSKAMAIGGRFRVRAVYSGGGGDSITYSISCIEPTGG